MLLVASSKYTALAFIFLNCMYFMHPMFNMLVLINAKGNNNVIPLTAQTFKSKVMLDHPDDVWLVEFMAPWCGHCKSLAPEWEVAAKTLMGKVHLAVVDATVETELASTYGIAGYPTIKVFNLPNEKPGTAQDYKGGRTAKDIIQFVDTLGPDISTTVKIPYLVYQETYTYLHPADNVPIVLLFVKKDLPKFKIPSWVQHVATKLSKNEGKKSKKLPKGRLAIVLMGESNIKKQFGVLDSQLPVAVYVHPKEEKYAMFAPSSINSLKMTQEVLLDFIRQQREMVMTSDEAKDALTLLPNFPSPDVPKKAPKYAYDEMTTQHQYEQCFQHKGKMCVLTIVNTNEKVDHMLMQNAAKQFRRDPFVFYWISKVSKFANVLLPNPSIISSNRLIVFKKGKTIRESVLGGSPEAASVFSKETIHAFLEGILSGNGRFQRREEAGIPSFIEGKNSQSPEEKVASFDDHEHIEL